MSKTRTILALLFALFSSLILILDSFKKLDPNLSDVLKNFSFLLLGFVLTEFINFLEIYGTYIKVFFQSFGKEKIRLSFAYLIRIKHKEHYLLIKSHRIDNQFQPVGGVYEYYDNSIVSKYELSIDEGYKDSPKKDLRKMMLRPYKNLAPFLIWFKSQKGRELSPHREFFEELLEDSILDKDLFKTPSFKYIESYLDGIHFSQNFQVSELRLFDVFELEPDEFQEKEIERLFLNQNSAIVFLTEEIIRKNGYDKNSGKSIRLGGHTKNIL